MTIAKSRQQAFDIACEKYGINSDSLAYDTSASEKSGYPIYRDINDYYTYICDLTTRLEINSSNGKSYNVWIKTETETAKAQYKSYSVWFEHPSVTERGILKTERIQADIDFDSNFTLSKLNDFESFCKTIFKKAIKAVSSGDYFTLTAFTSLHYFNSCGHCQSLDFNEWTCDYGNQCENQLYFSPKEGNANMFYDFVLDGKTAYKDFVKAMNI